MNPINKQTQQRGSWDKAEMERAARRVRLHDHLSKRRHDVGRAIVHRDMDGLHAEVGFERTMGGQRS